jgi:hypothetical protein
MLSSQGTCKALEEEIIVSPTKIAIGSSSAWVRLTAFGAAVWLIAGVGMLGSSLGRVAGQSKGANVSVCALRALRQEAYCPLSGRQFGSGHYEPGESELNSGLLLDLQGRS